ncbi:hypothetical protein F5J12DRAFT_98163 [Pisolithus orientalis]|uniref:uncharacterized protein n=1 Tax=Pisolithus orientalis TaxID=936130 RepID=UPI0022256F03|nr:uncharacterized protein F5J12DRAFT_98163 [Pisolithus orientalis]KAI6006531.1 hypothetical protein F5J12DRAFT_98163 [Pisolithus orientalis]
MAVGAALLVLASPGSSTSPSSLNLISSVSSWRALQDLTILGTRRGGFATCHISLSSITSTSRIGYELGNTRYSPLLGSQGTGR